MSESVERFIARIRVATLMAQDAGAEVEKARAALRRAELEAAARLSEVEELVETLVDMQGDEAIPMLLHCPACAAQHIDEGEFAERAHLTHDCACGHSWTPCSRPTVGVRSIEEAP